MCIGWTKKRNTVYNNIFLNSKGKKKKGKKRVLYPRVFFFYKQESNQRACPSSHK